MSAPVPLLAACADYLEGTYLPRLERALKTLPAGDLWWRPHGECLAFGTLLVHLEGNVRQWVLSGLLGQPDHRQRSAEFAADGSSDPRPGAELLAALAETVQRSAAGLRGLDPASLERTVTIQGFETTVQEAALHVVEHFSWHTGQATWIAKARAGADHGLAFYDDAALDDARNG